MDGWNTILSVWVSAYVQVRTLSFRKGNLLLRIAGGFKRGETVLAAKDLRVKGVVASWL